MKRVCRIYLCKLPQEQGKGASRPAGSDAQKCQSLQRDKSKGKVRTGGKSAEVMRLTSTDNSQLCELRIDYLLEDG